jgi:hypothetical protein
MSLPLTDAELATMLADGIASGGLSAVRGNQLLESLKAERDRYESTIATARTDLLNARRELRAMSEILQAERARCSGQRAEMARANRRIANAPPGELRALGHLSAERRLQDERFGTPADLLDVPLGNSREHYAEALRAVRKDAADHCDLTGRETCCWTHVILEEAYEIAAEEESPKAIRQETVQLGAVCVRVIEAIDLRAAVAK